MDMMRPTRPEIVAHKGARQMFWNMPNRCRQAAWPIRLDGDSALYQPLNRGEHVQ